MRVAAALIVVVLVSQTLLAAEDTSPVGGSESIGGQLLDDLPAEGGTPILEAQPTLPAADSLEQPDPELRYFPLRFDDVGKDGEDFGGGRPSGPLQLARAGQGMRQAELLLRKEATLDQASDAQVQVVAQLDDLIRELSKQCNGQSGATSNASPPPSQRTQRKPGKTGNRPGQGSRAARDSNAQLRDSASDRVSSKDELEKRVEQLWGHLPERQREQMLQSFSDEFLPKYELEIGRYFERLSEESLPMRPEESGPN
jgi:hypothetical protein